MRSAAQLSRLPGEWKDAQAAERQNVLRELLVLMRRARDERAEWYQWIAGGCPPLTPEEYEARQGRHARGGQPARTLRSVA